jgi:hypothetical protein
MIERSHHDMGGLPGGKVEPTEHDYEEWERRIDAMAVLLWGLKGTKKFLTVDEHRNAIESLPPAAYDRMTYYEKWIVALSQCLIRRGVITSEELGRKMGDVAAERRHHDLGGRPAGKVEPSEHDYEPWERRVDAFMVLLAGVAGSAKLMSIDERRNNIENLPPEAYDGMKYYERMLSSMTLGMIQRGLITGEELARKMAEVKARD